MLEAMKFQPFLQQCVSPGKLISERSKKTSRLIETSHKKRHHYAIKYCRKKAIAPKDIRADTATILRHNDSVLSKVRMWVAEFRGRKENLEDDTMAGRPANVSTEEKKTLFVFITW